MDASGLTTDATGQTHCTWRTAAPEYPRYHDHEWGVPVADDSQLYEKICLEGFQAGMAWITILRKREQFRAAFEGFDFRRVAQYGEADIARLMNDPGIVRNRAKIVSTINNARRACELVEETGSLAHDIGVRASRGGAPGRGGHGLLDRQPNVTGFGALIQSLENTRLDFCRPDHDVCVYAGDGHGQ